MTPYYEQGGIEIYHGDAREIAPLLQYDAVISDPPYKNNTDSTRFTGGLSPKIQRKRGHGRSDWRVSGYDEPFDPTLWAKAGWVVLWGYHHFADQLAPGTVLVWLKRAPHLLGTFLSDCELAWRKGGEGVYAHVREFSPPERLKEARRGGKCVHPNQKPLSLMEWSIKMSGTPRDRVILDPFMGSGTTLVAAKNLFRRAIGIETHERHCETAAKRLEQNVLDFGATA